MSLLTDLNYLLILLERLMYAWKNAERVLAARLDL